MIKKINKLQPQNFSNRLSALKGISPKNIEEHLKLYQGYVSKYNEIMEKISALTDDDYAKANQSYSNIRELKVEATFAWCGVVNHELYFSHLGSVSKPAKDLLIQIQNDFGSLDTFKKDFKATGLAARGWVIMGWNCREKRLFNYLSDSHNIYAVWGVVPVMILDTYEHAYFIDFGTARAAYIDAFFENINWDQIAKNLKKAKSSP